MSNFAFNVAKGRLAHYASLPGASDSLLAIPLEASGVESDSVLLDKDDLAAVLAGSTNEQSVMGRKALSNVTITVDDTNDRVVIDCDDVTWAAATGNPIAGVIIAYKPSSAAVDSAVIPMTKHDFTMTPNGGDITMTIPLTGLYRIS